MRKIIYILLVIMFFGCKTESEKTETKNNNPDFNEIIIDPIEYNAEFKYGNDSLMKIIYSNMKITENKGTVWVSMVIDSFGNIGNIKIRKTENEKLNLEAIKLVKLIPNEWKPAEFGPERKKINTKYTLPIQFDEAVKIIYCK